jgi:hypothetical protein
MTTTQQRHSTIDTLLARIDETLADYERSRVAVPVSVPTFRPELQEVSR